MGKNDFVIRKFQEYYRDNNPVLPPRFSSREYGFMSFDREGMIRHIKFNSEGDLKRFLVENIPAHSYYSSAYYRYPERQRMEEKEWLGADLIFDLDADHIVKGSVSYEEMLDIVKAGVKRIIDDYLIPDLGIDPRNISIVFSGGRGYHIHVRQGNVYNLGSDERREIVNYITGENANFNSFIKRDTEGNFIVPDEEDPGWYGKISKAIINVSKKILYLYEKGDTRAIDEMMKSSNVKNRRRLMNALFSEKKLFSEGSQVTKKVVEILAEKGNRRKLNYLGDEELILQFLDIVKNYISDEVAGKTDEPVTTDVHRLIRLPGTLHGKTGLIVKPLKIEEIDNFNPLEDAVYSRFSKNVKINLSKNFSIKMMGERFDLSEGEQEVPEFLALFLVLRNIADI
ncbi:MAG: DNA primase catalytic subunit PriS [Euryarchaeota archaeon]|nr:DNA primase catalytic subunit PriS [Euryarchaeota archaeon]